MKATPGASGAVAAQASAPASAQASALARLVQRWRALLRQFNQRSERERVLLIGAAAALALMLADLLWLGPALQAFKAARSEQASARQLQQTLQADLARLQTDGQQQARSQQAELARWRAQLRDGDAALRSHEDSLVGPERMLGLLEQLLARHGALRVRALRSLGRSDLLTPGVAAANTTAPTAPAAPAASAATASPGAGNNSTGGLYRHGVELVVEGSYADLLGWLRAMEALPQRLLWGSVQLKVDNHPNVVLTLRVYTLSRDPHWLEI